MKMKQLATPFRIAIFAGISATFGPAQQPEHVKVLITFQTRPEQAERDLVRSNGGRILRAFHLVPVVSASVPPGAINGLRADPDVRSVDLDGIVHAHDELLDTWGVQRIGAENVHAVGNRGAGVRVGVLDSGIDYLHPDLDGNFAGGHDFANGDADPRDDHGHGTHVSGTLAAEYDGVGVVGVAPEASLYALKVLDAAGGGTWGNVIAGLQWCVDRDIQVTNNSYGSGQNPGGAVQAAFDAAMAAGILHVASAGNSGNPKGKGNSVGWPARYVSVIAVAATRPNDTRASFSSTGDEVEIAAPGVDINSTLIGGGYGEADGTSMASPHVAGAAALVIAAGTVGPDAVRQRLQETADDLGDPGRDPQYGFGLVDAAEAAPPGAPADPANEAPVVTIASPGNGSESGSGEALDFSGSALDPEDGEISASLVWTSSLDGQIGSGGSFPAILGDGVHTITASVTDSGGRTASASIDITVGLPPSGPATASVQSIGYATSGGKNSDRHLFVTLTVVGASQDPVGGAFLAMELVVDTGASWSGTGTTSGEGTVTFTLKNAPAGWYTATITELSAPGLVWDGVTPVNGFEKN